MFNPKFWKGLYLSFGVLSVISGAYLIIQRQYLRGIFSFLVGVWLVKQLVHKPKKKE